MKCVIRYQRLSGRPVRQGGGCDRAAVITTAHQVRGLRVQQRHRWSTQPPCAQCECLCAGAAAFLWTLPAYGALAFCGCGVCAKYAQASSARRPRSGADLRVCSLISTPTHVAYGAAGVGNPSSNWQARVWRGQLHGGRWGGRHEYRVDGWMRMRREPPHESCARGVLRPGERATRASLARAPHVVSHASRWHARCRVCFPRTPSI